MINECMFIILKLEDNYFTLTLEVKKMMNNYDNEKQWIPEEGDVLEGFLFDKLSNIGKYESNLYKIIDKDEDIYVIWGKLRLDQLLKKAVIGDYLIIKYKGKVKTSDEHMMNEYEVEIIEIDEED